MIDHRRPFPEHCPPRYPNRPPNTGRVPACGLVAPHSLQDDAHSRFHTASIISPLLGIAFLLFSIACERVDDGSAKSAQTSGTNLTILTERRGNLQIVGADTLSESARVLALFPEPDGAAIAFTFADSASKVSSALGLLDSGKESAQLIWPDSVTHVVWPGAHRLSWTASSTHGGVHAVVDVHNAELSHIEEDHPIPPTTSAAGNSEAADLSARARATSYIDSLRLQPIGVPSKGTLRYSVTRVVHSPSDSLVAFYVIARGSEGSERMNPTWYALDLRTGLVAPVDSLTGSANALAETTATWIENGRFVYVKGLTLHEAKVRRR